MNQRLLVASLVLLGSGLGQAAPAQVGYVSYQTFEAWRSLAPELTQPRVCNLAVAGHELWALGELRLPAETFLHGDLRHLGTDDWAVALADGDDSAPCGYVLVITRAAGGWQRLLLQPVAPENGSSGFSLVWQAQRPAIGLDFGQRKRLTAPATLVWQDGRVVQTQMGYVLELVLVRQIIEWVEERGRYEYRRAASAEEWDPAGP